MLVVLIPVIPMLFVQERDRASFLVHVILASKGMEKHVQRLMVVKVTHAISMQTVQRMVLVHMHVTVSLVIRGMDFIASYQKQSKTPYPPMMNIFVKYRNYNNI